MLARGSTDYITHPKVACMMDLFPLSKIEQLFSSPKVINTHYRLDVLPQEFQGRKTVLGEIMTELALSVYPMIMHWFTDFCLKKIEHLS